MFDVCEMNLCNSEMQRMVQENIPHVDIRVHYYQSANWVIDELIRVDDQFFSDFGINLFFLILDKMICTGSHEASSLYGEPLWSQSVSHPQQCYVNI